MAAGDTLHPGSAGVRRGADTLPVAVIGGGITGLTAAWRLQQAGIEAVVFEASPRVGGAIGGWRVGGWLHELGPNSLLENSADVTGLIDELKLANRRLYAADAAKKRYIVRDGRPRAMPTSPLSFATTGLFSWRAKAKLLGEPWRPPAPADAEESVADFVIRRLGREFLDYAVNPFVGGVYAGDPARLSVRHGFPKLWTLEQTHGSLIRGALARRNTSGGPAGRMFSFVGGLQELPDALHAALGAAVRLQRRVVSVRRVRDRWEVEFEAAGERVREWFAAVISALPADALARLQFADMPEASALGALAAIEHPPVASVFTGFRREAVAHPLDGFGMLVPQVENGKILGTLFSSSLFAGRAPEGHVGLTSFVGGVRQPELAERTEEEIVALVQGELRRLLGVRGEPAFVHVQRWPRAIPQYTLGWERFAAIYQAFETLAPGFFIGGNARDGISLSNCIASGRRLAAAVQAKLAGQK